MEERKTAASIRGRKIGIAMAAIAIAAIVAHFGAESLHLPWLREAAVLIILAEILVFVALERYQVFEPMGEAIAEVRGRLESLEQIRSELAASGYALAASDAPSTHQGLVDLLEEALAKKPATPQMLRVALLGGRYVDATSVASAAPQYVAVVTGIRAFSDTLENRARRPWVASWSVRTLVAIGDERSLEGLRAMLASAAKAGHTNQTIKLLPRPGTQAAIAPVVVGDQAVALGLEENSLAYPHWGVLFRGQQYAALFARWFDELWQDPEVITVFTRGTADDAAFERVCKRVAELRVAQRSSN